MLTTSTLSIQGFLKQKVKDDTHTKYLSAAKHLFRWWNLRIHQLHYPHLSARYESQLTPLLFTNFLSDLQDSGKGYSTANHIRCYLALHQQASQTPLQDITTKSPTVKAALKAYKASTLHNKTRRFPIREYILPAIAAQIKHTFHTHPLQATLLILALYLSYYCMLRVSELMHPHLA